MLDAIVNWIVVEIAKPKVETRLICGVPKQENLTMENYCNCISSVRCPAPRIYMVCAAEETILG
jgi:hypothetical protein